MKMVKNVGLLVTMTTNKLVMTDNHVNVLMMLIGMMIMKSVGTIVLKSIVKVWTVAIKKINTVAQIVMKWVTTMLSGKVMTTASITLILTVGKKVATYVVMYTIMMMDTNNTNTLNVQSVLQVTIMTGSLMNLLCVFLNVIFMVNTGMILTKNVNVTMILLVDNIKMIQVTAVMTDILLIIMELVDVMSTMKHGLILHYLASVSLVGKEIVTITVVLNMLLTIQMVNVLVMIGMLTYYTILTTMPTNVYVTMSTLNNILKDIVIVSTLIVITTEKVQNTIAMTI